MFVSRVVSENGLRSTSDGVSIDIRVPWYRSLPLSVVSIAEVKIDGEIIQPESLSLEANGRCFQLDELRSHSSEWWFVLDSALLHIKGKHLTPGTEHTVTVGVGIRPPYIPGFFRITECTRQLTVH